MLSQPLSKRDCPGCCDVTTNWATRNKGSLSSPGLEARRPKSLCGQAAPAAGSRGVPPALRSSGAAGALCVACADTSLRPSLHLRSAFSPLHLFCASVFSSCKDTSHWI